MDSFYAPRTFYYINIISRTMRNRQSIDTVRNRMGQQATRMYVVRITSFENIQRRRDTMFLHKMEFYLNPQSI